MKSISIFAFSLGAALVGALVWVLVAYFLNIELGWIAWGIGVLAGLGARFGARELVGLVPGAIATIASLLGVAIGKIGVIVLVVSSAAPSVTTDEAAIEWVAFSIAQERIARGEDVAWPPGVDLESELTRKDFPADVWGEAEARWTGFSDHQKGRYRAHPIMMNQAWATALIADEVVDEWQRAGKAIAWPADSTQSSESTDPTSYPPDVWGEAERRYAALEAPAREAYEDQICAAVDSVQASLVGSAFIASLSAWDALWAGLAAWSAFRIGKGAAGTPTAATPE